MDSAKGCIYPRILVICYHGLNYKSATGIVFSNLFEGWPQHALAQIYCEAEAPDTKICPTAMRLSVENVPVDRVIRKLAGRKIVQQMGPSPQQQFNEADGTASAFRLRLRSAAAAWADIAPYRMDQNVRQWVHDFAPQLIFTNLGSIRQMRLARTIAAQEKIPIVSYFNDDWPTTHMAGDVLKCIPRALLLRELRKTLRHTIVGAAASALMAKEYSERFAVPFTPFMYCFPSPDAAPAVPNDKQVRFCYVGGLHLDRWKALAVMGQIAAELRASGLPAHVQVHAPEEDLRQYGSALVESGVEVMGSLPWQQVHEALVSSHVLLHVESFQPRLRAFTRLSFSTKLPQYLAAGRPILAWGPEELASCRYVEDTGTGLVVGHQDRATLKAKMLQLATDAPLRKQMGKQAWRTSAAQHESRTMRERFRCFLAAALRQSAR